MFRFGCAFIFAFPKLKSEALSLALSARSRLSRRMRAHKIPPGDAVAAQDAVLVVSGRSQRCD